MATIKPPAQPVAPSSPSTTPSASVGKPAAAPAAAKRSATSGRAVDTGVSNKDPAQNSRSSYLTGGRQPLPDNAGIGVADGPAGKELSNVSQLARSGQETKTPARSTRVGGGTETSPTAAPVPAKTPDAVADEDMDTTSAEGDTSTASADLTTTASATRSVAATALPGFKTLASSYEALQKQAYTSQDVTEPTQKAFATDLLAYIDANVSDPDAKAAFADRAKTLLDGMMASVTKQQTTGELSNESWDQIRVKMEALMAEVAPEGAPAVYSPVAPAAAAEVPKETETTPETEAGETEGGGKTTTDPTLDPDTKPAGGTGGTGGAAGVQPSKTTTNSKLTDAQLKFFNDPNVVLSTDETPGVTSGKVKNFKLFPTGTPSPDDINQQSQNDCYYLAALSSMSATKAGQTKIKEAISGPDASGAYGVKMYDPDNKPVEIKVTPNNLPLLSDGSGEAAWNEGIDKNGTANWANLFEAAYAKYNEVYKTNSEPGNAALTGYDALQSNASSDTTFMQALTGLEASAFDTTDARVTPQKLAAAFKDGLASGTPITAYNLTATNNSDSKGNTFIASHAYSVIGVSNDGNNVTVRNPWGANRSNVSGSSDGTIVMSMQDFLKEFEQVNL